jgi:tetratricopeptide (TPR) repeat protein
MRRLWSFISYANYQLVVFALAGVGLWVLTSVRGSGPSFSRDVFETAVALDPTYATGQRVLGEALAREGRTQEALEHLRAAFLADPHDGATCLPLGKQAAKQRALGEARTALECAVKYTPGSAEAWEALSGVALAQQEFPRCIEASRKALELDPTRNALRMNLGTALARSGDGRGAEQVFAEGARRAPDDALMAFNLGLALKKRDAFDEAATWLQRAVTLDPKESRAWFHLATTQAARGHFDEARAAADRLVALDPTNADAQRLRQDLADAK